MSTSQEVKDAADAVALAKSALAAAEADVSAKDQAAFALIPDEIADYQAATSAFGTALDGARTSSGWYDSEAARQAAVEAKDLAVAALVSATSSYDQS